MFPQGAVGQLRQLRDALRKQFLAEVSLRLYKQHSKDLVQEVFRLREDFEKAEAKVR